MIIGVPVLCSENWIPLGAQLLGDLLDFVDKGRVGSGNSKGAVFPVETTYRMVEATRNFDVDLSKINDPLEHLAWRWLLYATYWHDKARKRPGSSPEVERLIQYIEDYKIDGIVMHEAFSCRTWHVGLIWQLNQLKKVYRDIPSLVLESDIIDISTYNEADTRARIDAFLDTIEDVFD